MIKKKKSDVFQNSTSCQTTDYSLSASLGAKVNRYNTGQALVKLFSHPYLTGSI